MRDSYKGAVRSNMQIRLSCGALSRRSGYVMVVQVWVESYCISKLGHAD